MKLWLIISHCWGCEKAVIRAATRERAVELSGIPEHCLDEERVTEITADGPEEIIYEYEYQGD